MSLQDVMDLGKQPAALAELLNEELPVRYARRISMLEALPEWQTKESIRLERKTQSECQIHEQQTEQSLQ